MLEDIVLNVVDLMINSLEAKLEERIMNTLISFVGKAMQPSFGYWDEQIVIAILAFLQWLSYFIFSCSMLVLIADIAEENSSLRSGQFKTIEWPTIFINVLKAIAFIEIAPIAGRLSLELGGRLLWRMDVSGMLQGAVDISRIGWAMLAMTIAVIIFVLLGSIKFGQMLIQVLTVPFYIPDIVRGNTKAIGDWLHQTLAIACTYLFQYLRPITTELIKRENDWVAVRMATNEEREKIAKGELKIYEKTYFAISKVYDISQTDFPKDRYPEIYSMGQKSMDHAEVYACVKELARASGIPVKKEQLPSISLHGYYSPSENAITINSNLEDTKAAVTLCHEYAHGLLHRTSTQSEAICEFEAQSLALMLMARYGLPQDDSEIGYMKTYLERANNDKNFSLDTSLERLQKQLKFVDERISLIAEHRQTEFAQTRAQAREPGKGKQVSENFRVGL